MVQPTAEKPQSLLQSLEKSPTLLWPVNPYFSFWVSLNLTNIHFLKVVPGWQNFAACDLTGDIAVANNMTTGSRHYLLTKISVF